MNATNDKTVSPVVLLVEPDEKDREWSKRGLPAWRLLRYYLGRGKPVVVIAAHHRKDRTFRPEQVRILSSNPGLESLLLSVKSMLKEAHKW